MDEASGSSPRKGSSSPPPPSDITQLVQSPYDSVLKQKEKGKTSFKEGQYKKAIEYFGKAIDLLTQMDPPSPPKTGLTKAPFDTAQELATLYSNRSVSYHHLSKFEKALKDALNAAVLKPTWSKAHFRKAECYFALKRYEDALESYRISLNLIKSSGASLDASIHLVEERIWLVQLALACTGDDTRLYFKVFLPGRDICLRTLNPITKLIFEFAKGMKNQIYAIGDRATQQCVLVDPAWDIDKILELVHADGMRVIGTICTHYHVDHVGGKPPPPFDAAGVQVQGLKRLLSKAPKPSPIVYIGPDDIPFLLEQEPGVTKDQLTPTSHRQMLHLGALQITFLHTPGHSSGSQCILVSSKRPSHGSASEQSRDLSSPTSHPSFLLTGDTLFIGSCGRYDLPGGNLEKLYHSLQDILAPLPEDTLVFPGHAYGGERTSIGAEKSNGLLKKMTFEEFQRRLGSAATVAPCCTSSSK